MHRSLNSIITQPCPAMCCLNSKFADTRFTTVQEQMQHLMRQRDSAQQAAKTAAKRQTAASDAQQVSARDADACSE